MFKERREKGGTWTRVPEGTAKEGGVAKGRLGGPSRC